MLTWSVEFFLKWNIDSSNTRYHSMVTYIEFTTIILDHVLRIECMMQVCWLTTHHWIILIKGKTRNNEIEVKFPDTAANSCHFVSIACSLVFNFNKTTRKLFFGNDNGASACCKRHMHTLKLLLFYIISSGLNIEPCLSLPLRTKNDVLKKQKRMCCAALMYTDTHALALNKCINH